MRAFLRRLLLWAFGSPLALLERQASEYGRITLSQMYMEIRPGVSGLGWHCLIRSTGDLSAEEFGAWTAEGETIEEALSNAISAAKGNPVDQIKWAVCAPKLGGAEHDGDD